MKASLNPLLDAFTSAQSTPNNGIDLRQDAIAKYGFAVPTEEALDHIARCSPAGVVEIGAGTGYWARLLHDRGTTVEAFDIDPPPSEANPWFAGREPWHPVRRADHTIVRQFPERTLLIAWPTQDDVWPSAAIELYHEAGGALVVFIGEVGGGGGTGDHVFHAMLGELGPCLQCRYGVLTAPCTCDVAPLWTRQAVIALPHWPGYDDNVHVYTRATPIRRSSKRVARLGWRRRRDG